MKRITPLLGALLCVAVWAGAPPDPAFGKGALSWSRPMPIDRQAPFSRPVALYGVSCPTVGLCVAVDAEGDVLSSTNAGEGTGSRWVVKHIAGARELSGVSCPSSSFCVAVDESGHVVTSHDPIQGLAAKWEVTQIDAPRGLNDVWCSARLCLAVGADGTIASSIDPGRGARARWRSRRLPGGGELTGVSCATETLCVAVQGESDGLAGRGRVLISTDARRGRAARWRATVLGDGDHYVDFSSVSCVEPLMCVVGDRSAGVLSSGDPAAGRLATWVAKHFMLGPDLVVGAADLACVSSVLCVAVNRNGEVIATTDPRDGASARWAIQEADDGRELNSVSCASSALCVAVDQGGRILSSTDPGDGATARWAVSEVDGTNDLSGIACSSRALCVAVSDRGTILTSSDPSSASSWIISQFAHVDFSAVSCVNARCAAVDRRGNLVTSTDASAATRASWSIRSIDAGHELTAISCASSSLCVAVDREGGAVISTNPWAGAGAVWRRARIDREGLTGVSCLSSLCVAVDTDGKVLTLSEPARAATPWVAKRVDATRFTSVGLEGISCASRKLCVAVDMFGRSIVSRTAFRGSKARWTLDRRFQSKRREGFPVGVSCASSTLCVAVENGGWVATNTDPSRAAARWIATRVERTTQPNAVSCPAPDLCVAVDGLGRVLVGTPRHGLARQSNTRPPAPPPVGS